MDRKYDVVIVGATPGGIMAAIGAARRGRRVLLLERTSHIGGLPANGLGATDIITRGATGGLFKQFIARIRGHYARTYGEKSPQVQACSEGFRFEPSVAERVLEQMIAEHPTIEVLKMRQFDVRPDRIAVSGGRIQRIIVLNRETGALETYAGDVFIDGTYEGDLAGAAGAPFRLGREGAAEFNEPCAGKLYKIWDGPIGEGSTGEADDAVQSYNYRVCLTQREDLRLPIPRPASYNRDEYVSLIDDLKHSRHTGLDEPMPRDIRWLVCRVSLPNGKTDSNNNHQAFISTDLPEENWPWPTADWDWRDRFAGRLRDYILGLFYFAQHDPELPEDFRKACLTYGLAKDEYVDNGNFPRQVYVREGRRIVGEYLFTAHDALPAAGGERPPLHADSITASHYDLDSHAVRKREPGRVHLDGFFSIHETKPYTVPYRVIVPKQVENLLVPVAVSATHVGFSTLRMEPCWMAMGEAAGEAADLAINAGVATRNIDIAALQRRLLEHGAVLLYYSDATPADPAFDVLQILGLRGVLREWEARLDEPALPNDAANWAKALGVPQPTLANGTTRRELMRMLGETLNKGE